MQIIGSFQIVTVVTSVAPTFFSCIALFVFVTFALLLFVLLYSLECAWGVSLLRERPRALPFGFPQAFEKA